MAGNPKGFAAALDLVRLLRSVELGWHARSHPSRTLCEVPRGGRQRSEPHRRSDRQPEREKRRKRGASIDPPGYDAGKKIKGKKRHILVDTHGLLIHAIVHAADIQDRDGGALVMATMFGLYPFRPRTLCRWRLSRPGVPSRCEQNHGASECRDRQALGPRQRLCRAAKAMGGRTHIRMARALSTARQGLGKSQSKGARVPASRFHQADVEKAMQSRMISPDRLLESDFYSMAPFLSEQKQTEIRNQYVDFIDLCKKNLDRSMQQPVDKAATEKDAFLSDASSITSNLKKELYHDLFKNS